MSDRQAKFIVDKIQKGNREASIALIKTFGLVKLSKCHRPQYYWQVRKEG